MLLLIWWSIINGWPKSYSEQLITANYYRTILHKITASLNIKNEISLNSAYRSEIKSLSLNYLKRPLTSVITTDLYTWWFELITNLLKFSHKFSNEIFDKTCWPKTILHVITLRRDTGEKGIRDRIPSRLQLSKRTFKFSENRMTSRRHVAITIIAFYTYHGTLCYVRMGGGSSVGTTISRVVRARKTVPFRNVWSVWNICRAGISQYINILLYTSI